MTRRLRILSLPLALAAAALPPAGSARPAVPEGPDPSFLEQYAATLRFSLGTPQSFQFVPAGRAVLFLRSGPRSFVRDLYELDLATGEERVLARAETLLGGGEERLSAEEKARRERARLTARGIAGFDLSEDGARVLVPLSGRLFVVERLSGAVRELPAAGGFPLDPRFSPDGMRVACIRDGDLRVLDLGTGAGGERRLTAGAGPTLSHGLAEFVAQEEMGRREGYWWSPDSRTIAYEEADTAGVEVLHIADPMHPERAADSWPYPRPGHPNARVRLGLVPAAGGATVWVEWDRESYPYLASASWRKEGPLTLLVQNREQTEEILLAVDPASGRTRRLLAESDDAWLNLFHSVPHWLPGGPEAGFLWISERTGEPRLELRAAGGRARRWLTPEGFGLRTFLGVDPAGAAAYVTASADPTQDHIWRVPLAPSDAASARDGEPAALTREPGIHHAVWARDGAASVWMETLLSGARSWTARRGGDGSGRGKGGNSGAGRLTNDGATGDHRTGVSSAAAADIVRPLRSVGEQPSFFPNLELAAVGPLGFRTAIVRPRAFRPGRRYPVLVHVYGGPTAQVARSDPWGYLLDQWIADHDFVVLAVDGRGTPGRGRAWERVVKGNLIDLPLADQVAGLQAAAAKYPELDLTRAGMFGWSFGGYFSAMAAMRRPDVFKAAVAGAPVCDWLDYDTHYTERYLGLPRQNPEGYRKSSVLTYCADLKVPLLIIHGTADDNVYFVHSLKMTDALFRAGRTYEFLPLPGFTHMVPDAAVQRALQERILSFFAAHLGP
jgi:dipeptidyl-peptidase-4